MQLPRRIGRYVIEQPLGRGGMAEVFRGRLDDGGFQKAVCLKRVLPQLAGQTGFLDMFRDEAQLAARLTHPHIVQALDLVSAEDTLWLVLELVEGANLKAVLEMLRMAGERMPLAQALYITTCISRALQHAHTATSVRGEPLEVIHRDVSPDNVLLGTAGEVKLGDFGVARARERLAARTATGSIKGKPGYMAPEQLLGEPSDHRVDQFTMASVLWEMLAGRPLFQGKAEIELAEAVVACIVPPLPANVPPAIEAIVMRALCRDPTQRFPSMAPFEAALARELYAHVQAPGDVDVRALVVRTHLESGATMRMARAPARDTAPDGAQAQRLLAAGQAPQAWSEEFVVDERTALSAGVLEVTARLERAPPMEATAPLAALPRAGERPRGDAPAADAPGRRLWLLFGATVAAGAIAASVTAAVVVRSLGAARAGTPVARRAPGTAAAAPAPPALAFVTPPAPPGPMAAAAAGESALAVAVLAEEPLAADGVLAAATLASSSSSSSSSPSPSPRMSQLAKELAAARRALLAGRIEDAVPALQAILAVDPLNAEAHRMLGVSYGKLEDPSRATAHYRMYLSLRPDAADAAAVRAAIGQQLLP